MQWDSVFRLTKNYKLHKNYIETLHGFSNKVISERKQEILNDKLNNNLNNNCEEQVASAYDDFGKKKRLAFLDLLIEASKEGSILSNEDIREEVDTFMFEGHDTTSAAISWTLFLLGSNQEIQDKVVQEMNDIFQGDISCPATMKNLSDMKYLECCIKDALRLYPSVPMMARSINEDVKIGKNYLNFVKYIRLLFYSRKVSCTLRNYSFNYDIYVTQKSENLPKSRKI